ncbi:MAG: NAD-dependent epimerase/dehydratase family protein [Gammaproteobacteria bacterium]
MNRARTATHRAGAQNSRPLLGVQEWLRPGEHERVEHLLADLKALQVRELRTGFSWADWHIDQGRAWYDWLLPRLAGEVNVIPCFTYTPPSLGVQAKTSAPPRNPRDYADFLDVIITRLGAHFTWVELWNEPNNINDWDWRLDPQWNIFCEMIGAAAYWARQRGKKTLLGGMAPTDPNWLDLLCHKGVLEHIDVVGAHGFPGTWEFDWDDWGEPIGKLRQVLERHRLDTQIWITEAGYSTWRHDEFRQLRVFEELLRAPVERVYWYSAYDLHPDMCHQDGFHEDERHYHFGLKDAHGKPKLLYRAWAEDGLDGVRALARLGRAAGANLTRNTSQRRIVSATKVKQRPALITGGAGFIGTNLAARLLADKQDVLILDNLARPGVERNLRWLHQKYGKHLRIEIADIRDPHLVRDAVRGAGQVFHLAAQVAVTTSLQAPVQDFEINARGTLNVLEALRGMDDPPPLVFTSSNKVYGNLRDIPLRKTRMRYEPADLKSRRAGIDEARRLEFHSPYGCSKGAADQYVLDYARCYGLPAVVFRMSCIYGPHQFGTEDQGWVAHFLIRALAGEPITIYGDGRQVRDLLYVDDLTDALLAAQQGMAKLSGQAFNIGGGPANTVSLLEVIEHIAALESLHPALKFGDWRNGDQKYYVSDIGRFQAATGWSPSVGVREGVTALVTWLRESRGEIEPRAAKPVAAW